MSLREFPGLLRQLPQHKPWMITIGVISVVVVLAACSFGSFLMLKDDGQPTGLPSDANVQRRDISTREGDSTPLTVADIFPDTQIPAADPSLPPYTMVGKPQAGKDCRYAANREVQRRLGDANCSQYVRASFLSSDGKYFVTAGILNLPDMPSATDFQTQLQQLAATADQGSLTIYVPDTDKYPTLPSANSYLAADVRGHFLIYAVVVRKNGSDMQPDEPGAKVVVYDMLETYLSNAVTKWSEVKPPNVPSAGASSHPGSSATGSTRPSTSG
ncbi:MAG TPA: hypothetical protein VH561_00765 [Micromonosporaceae bacterium]|jgi:hypothetical protein